MKNYWFIILIAVLIAPTAAAQQVEVREETLDNGMKLLLVERHESPTIDCGWVARVGSVNERPGITGISHLFEHMMFKGTKTIGVTDYEKAAQIQAQQDEIRARMEEEYAQLREKLRRGEIDGNIYDASNLTPRLKEVRAELERLFAEEKKYLVNNELDQIYTRQGGSNLNAGTSTDQTFYMVTIPSNKLELWFWLESDRLLNPVFREFYSERDVVREERRLTTESTPTGKLDESFNAMFWQSSPYSWPIGGWPSDIESITRAEAERYFGIYYAPNNLTVALVGDFDSTNALELAKRYFGRIPRGTTPPPPVITTEVEQLGERRFRAEADTNTEVTLRFHAVPFNHVDSFPLQIMADALNGRTGRLYKTLVEEKDIVVGQPFAFLRDQKYEGYFEMGAQVKDGRTPEEVEAALLAEIDKLKEELLGERELQKVKNQEMADSFRRLRSNLFLMIQLVFYDSNDNWRFINDAPARLQAVTAEQIQKVARKYFTPEKRNVAVYVRKSSSQPPDPELAALPPQLQSQVRQQLSQLQSVTDVAQLQQALAQSQQMADKVPPEVKPAVEYMIRKIQERIDSLSSQPGDSPGKGNN